MSPRLTKSKNIEKYIYFLNYDDPREIPFNSLAERLGVHPNKLRGMMRSARSNSTIYLALRQMRYGDHQIPRWFARPEPPQRHGAASAQPVVRAKRRSGAEGPSVSARAEDKQAITYVAQMESAQRLSALSVRSAPPAYTYRAVQPTYQTPMHQMLREMVQTIQKEIEEDMRESLEREKKRKAARRSRKNVDQYRGLAEANRNRRRNEEQNAIATAIVMNMIAQQSRHPEQIDVEELKELFAKPFRELGQWRQTHQDAKVKKAVEVAGRIIEALTPRREYSEEFFREYRSTIREDRKQNRDALVEIAKIYKERRENKNYWRRIINARGQQLHL